jgi:hypothetical protein
MSEWINYNSVLLAAIPIAGFAVYIGWNYRHSKRIIVGLLIVLLVSFAGYFQLRTTSTEIPTGSLVTMIGHGDPVFVEIFSNT